MTATTRRRLGYVPGTKQQRGARTQMPEMVGTLVDGNGFGVTVYANDRCALTCPAWMQARDYTGWTVKLWQPREAKA